jgi:hypothetical protein
MKRNLAFALLVVILALSTSVTAALAEPPHAVVIESLETFTPGDTFTASGPSVVAGVMCPSGGIEDLTNVMSGPHGRFLHIDATKRLTCDDASGTIDVELQVRLNLDTLATTGRWSVIGGTGAYTTLHGGGRIDGTPVVPSVSIYDIYNGKVKN